MADPIQSWGEWARNIKGIKVILEESAKTSRFYAIKLFAMLNKYICDGV